MQGADYWPATRQCHVDALTVQRLSELALAHGLFTARKRLLECALDLVGGASHRAALVWAQLAQAAHQVGERALAAEVRNAPLLESSCVNRAVELRQGARFQRLKPLERVTAWPGVRVGHDGCDKPPEE